MSLLHHPEQFLKFLASYLAIALIVILALTVILSQGLYWGSVWFGTGDYAERQKAHHQFVCRPQVGPNIPDSGVTDQIRHRYFALMEVTRQEVSPPDFVGKFHRFILCSDFSRVGVGTVQLAATGSGSYFFDDMHVEEAQLRQGEYVSILARYPTVPDYLSDEVTCLLGLMARGESKLEAGMCSGEPDDKIEPTIQPENSTPLEPPKPTATGAPGVWILVSGADQSDDAALHEVKAAKAALKGATGVGATEVFLIRSWRRTVTYFDSKTDAENALDNNKSQLRYGGYIRSTTEWCDGVPTDVERTKANVRFWRCKF